MYLPDDVLHIIYKYKHQLVYSDIMNELIKFNCTHVHQGEDVEQVKMTALTFS